MRAGTKVIEHRKIDAYIPSSIACIRCSSSVDLTISAHYGRIVAKWKHQLVDTIQHAFNNGKVTQVPTVTDRYYPEKVTGYVCDACYTELYNTTSRDASGHLRRAFEVVHRQVEQPANDDYDASSITKGLYAPHVTKRKHGRKADYFETATKENGSPVIEHLPKVDRKLKGFNKFKREDLNIKPKRIVVKAGKWKEDPTKYDYKPPK